MDKPKLISVEINFFSLILSVTSLQVFYHVPYFVLDSIQVDFKVTVRFTNIKLKQVKGEKIIIAIPHCNWFTAFIGGSMRFLMNLKGISAKQVKLRRGRKSRE